LGIVSLLFFAGCGKQGYPVPPSLNLPLPPRDLRANRKADKVTLAWTQPRMTTDQAIAKKLGETKICRTMALDANTPMKSCDAGMGEVAPKLPISSDSPTVTDSYTDVLPAAMLSSHSTGFAIYAVEADNRYGKSGGLSNEVAVPLVPTLAPPGDMKAEVRADAVALSATGTVPPSTARLRFGYRITRTTAPPQPRETPVIVAQLSAGASIIATDTTFEWEKRYKYTITPYTELLSTDGTQKIAEVDGADSQPVEVYTHDVFPPAVPRGLQAVNSGVMKQHFIDLTWTPDTDTDLDGYNVYRQQAGGSWAKLNQQLLKTPAFRDENVSVGQTYTYSVSAVDLRGNESAKSEPATESVPQQQ
jgi:hypothetical protein